MGAVEPIAGERFDEREDLFGDALLDAVCDTAVDKFLALFGDKLLDLLADGLAQYVRFAERESCEVASDLHELFLIDGHAVGIAQDRFELGMQVFDFLAAVLAIDEVGDIVHRSGTIESDHGDDVLEDGRLELFEVALHAIAFQLEDTGRLGFLQQGIGFLVVERDMVHHVRGGTLDRVDADTFGEVGKLAERADDADGVLNDGEVFETEEVHLEKTDFLYCGEFGRRGILRDGRFAVACDLLKRGVGGHRILGDDDATSVYRCVTGIAFEFFRGVDDTFGILIALVECLEVGDFLDRLTQ